MRFEFKKRVEIEAGIDWSGNAVIRMRIIDAELKTDGWHDIPEGLYNEFVAKAVAIWESVK